MMSQAKNHLYTRVFLGLLIRLFMTTNQSLIYIDDY